jgi:hypothetical protein
MRFNPLPQAQAVGEALEIIEIESGAVSRLVTALLNLLVHMFSSCPMVSFSIR